MNIKEKLSILKTYFDSTHKKGHTTLTKMGTDNYDKPKLILTYNVQDHVHFNIKPTEIVSWNSFEYETGKLKGADKPIAIDNSVMTLILSESLEYIEELEYKLVIANIKLNTIKNIL